MQNTESFLGSEFDLGCIPCFLQILSFEKKYRSFVLKVPHDPEERTSPMRKPSQPQGVSAPVAAFLRRTNARRGFSLSVFLACLPYQISRR